MTDRLSIFRDMLGGSTNRVEKSPAKGDSGNIVGGFGGGGGQNFGPSFGGGGMDPWQSSVERQLGSLDARAGRAETTLSDIRADVSSLKATVSELPTKWFMVTAIATIGAIITGIAKLIEVAF